MKQRIKKNTKQLLSNALKQAMKNKPLTKITVNELITTCNVNRKTFYYHFEDIYALMKWTFHQEAIQVVKKFDLFTQPEDALNFIADYIESNEYLINCAYFSMGRDEITRFFYQDFYDIVLSIVEGYETQIKVILIPEYKHFIIKFYSEALSGILIDYFQQKQFHQREKVIKAIVEIMQITIPTLIKVSQKKFIDNKK